MVERCLICETCNSEASMLTNGDCYDCWRPKQIAWEAKMAARQDPAQFNMDRLVRLLLRDHWMHECKIDPAWMPAHPRPETRPICSVGWPEKDGRTTYLRYSLGPLQGYSWDIYPDDFHTPELALYALSQAPAPVRVDVVIPTYGT